MRALLWIATYPAAWLLAGVWLAGPGWLKVLLFPLAGPAMYYAATPVAARLRAWRYLSASLILYGNARRGPVALHLGTSYDVVWRLLPLRKPDERPLRTLHREIYRGLLAFCGEVRSGAVPAETVVTTCSYFLTPSQMARLGFTEAKAPVLSRLNFLLSYPEVLLQQWLLSGRLRLYHPGRVRFFRSTAGELLRRERHFERLTELPHAPDPAPERGSAGRLGATA